MNADPKALAAFMRNERQKRGWSAARLAELISHEAAKDGVELPIAQQTISSFEQGNAKREPSWTKYVWRVFGAADRREFEADDADEDHVYVAELPTHAGAGGGGTGEGEEGRYAVARSVVLHELKAEPRDILSVVIEGNSMHPDFQSGDRILVDRRKTSIAQPGAFCLWDGDGYVVKYLEKVPGSEPPQVRVISRNATFSTFDRLVEEVRIMGRVVWFARKV